GLVGHRQRRGLLRDGVLVLVFIRGERVVVFGLDERLLAVERRVSRRKDATIGEELADADRDVGPAEKPRQHIRWNAVQRRVRGGANLGIGIVEQQDQDRQLIVGAYAQAALRRQQPHVARGLAAL